jgi:hypothetical protein
MNKEILIQKLRDLSACKQAIEYVRSQPDPQSAWLNCRRGDWMLWLIFRLLEKDDEQGLRKLTLVKARFAKIFINLMKDKRSRYAVEIAERFGLGQASRKELDAAAAAAYAAADAAAADAAAAERRFAAAADAASYAAYAAVAAAYAAADAAYAEADAAADATYANIIRAEYPRLKELFA